MDLLDHCLTVIGPSNDNDVVSNNEQLRADFGAKDSKLFILAMHGKSKHPAVWSYEQLLASNQQLNELGPERLNSQLTYRVPECGVQAGLCGKCVILSQR